jgi:hypothetical protein
LSGEAAANLQRRRLLRRLKQRLETPPRPFN